MEPSASGDFRSVWGHRTLGMVPRDGWLLLGSQVHSGDLYHLPHHCPDLWNEVRSCPSHNFLLTMSFFCV